MDLHQSSSSSNFNQKSLENQVATCSLDEETKDDHTTEAENQAEMNPLQMGHVLEKVFSYLGVNSIKAARQVNPLWSAEGAKMLITKCYVNIPWGSWNEESTKNTKLEQFKVFLSNKKNETSMIPNIVVTSLDDVETWKSLEVLGSQVTSLKLTTIDNEAKVLQELLDLLPNLKYLSFRGMDYNRFEETQGPILRVLTSAMSKPEKDRNPLIISFLALDPAHVEKLKDIEKFSDCRNIMIEDFEFSMLSLYTFEVLSSIPNFEIRVGTAVSKLLSTSQSIMKELLLENCEMYLSLVKFPCMSALVHMELCFHPQTDNLLYDCSFSPIFRFSENIPILEHISLENHGFEEETDFFKNLFEKAGKATTVKSIEYEDCFSNANIDFIFQAFPNIEEFDASESHCSEEMLQSLLKHGKKFKKLFILIDLDEPVDLDSILTGFTPETVGKLEEPEIPLTFTYDEEVEKLRVNSSILDLKELEELRICFYGDNETVLPKNHMLAVAGERAFRLMPSNFQVIINVQPSWGITSHLVAALDKVSQLPNVRIIQSSKL